jgi:Bacterial lectin
MQSKINLIFILAVLLASSLGWAAERNTPTQPNIVPVFEFRNFNSVESFTLNGAAQTFDLLGTTYLEITPPVGSIASSAWYNTQVNVAQGFVTRFRFRIKQVQSSFVPADGFAFVIQNSGLSALGGLGIDIGYGGIADSLAVEFDTYLNSFDPNNNHVAIQSCGTGVNTSDHSVCNLGIQPNLPITLPDGISHEGTISYVPDPEGRARTMQVEIDRQPILTVKVNLQKLLELPGNNAGWDSPAAPAQIGRLE